MNSALHDLIRASTVLAGHLLAFCGLAVLLFCAFVDTCMLLSFRIQYYFSKLLHVHI